MKFEDKKNGDVLVVSILEKRLVASIADDFKKRMNQYISDGNSHIVLDMSNVEFVDSSGLGVMISVLKALGGNGHFAVCNLSEPIMKMFRMARMHKVFNITDREPEAVTSLS